LEAKKTASNENNSNQIIAALAARNIPFQVDEKSGEIQAKPSFTDNGAKEFLKQQGFKWKSSDKAWIKQAA
jgi:flagellar biosynthesis/type III secretory pathway M-ring protein FliF/YscJ